MGSVGFDGEAESQPSTSNGKKYKLPRTLGHNSSAVNYAPVPKKLRSAIKKRGRESVPLPLPILRKKRHVLVGAASLRKDGAKKSKLNKKPGHITKDEEEVAETLYALADMFSDANKSNQPESNDESGETKSSTILEAGSSMNTAEDTRTLTLQEESRKLSSNVTLEASHHSSVLVDSTAQVAKFQSLGNAPQPKLGSSKQPAMLSGSGVQSKFSLDNRQEMSAVDTMALSGEQLPAGIKYGKNYYPVNDKSNGLFQPPTLAGTGVLSSETQGSCLRLPSLFESTKCASLPRVTENGFTPEKTSWKRCSAHVYISRLIRVLQISDTKEALLEKPTQVTICQGAELRSCQSTYNKKTGEKDSAKIQNDILLHQRPLQDPHLASETTSGSSSSTQQVYDFLSLGSGVCGLNGRAGHSSEAPTQFHMALQNHSAMLLSLQKSGYSPTFHGHNSALAAQQAQVPQYLSSSFTDQVGQQLELQQQQQQKWATHLSTLHKTSGVGSPHLPEWTNGGRESSSMLNYAHTLGRELNYAHSINPHLHAAVGSKHQRFSSPQQQIMATKRPHHQPHFGFERNGTAFHHENVQHVQLPCNQHLQS